MTPQPAGVMRFLGRALAGQAAEIAALRHLLALPAHVAAQRVHHLHASLKFLAGIARAFGFANRKQEMNEQMIGRALRELHAEVQALRAENHQLKAGVCRADIECDRLHAEVASLRVSLGQQEPTYGAEPIGCPTPGACSAVAAAAMRGVAQGCVCPAGAEARCKGLMCPRRSPGAAT